MPSLFSPLVNYLTLSALCVLFLQGDINNICLLFYLELSVLQFFLMASVTVTTRCPPKSSLVLYKQEKKRKYSTKQEKRKNFRGLKFISCHRTVSHMNVYPTQLDSIQSQSFCVRKHKAAATSALQRQQASLVSCLLASLFATN